MTLENKALRNGNFKCCGLMRAGSHNTRWLHSLMLNGTMAKRKYHLQRKNTLLFYWKHFSLNKHLEMSFSMITKNIHFMLMYYIVLHIPVKCATCIWTKLRGLWMGEFSAIFLWNTTLWAMFWNKVTPNPDIGNTESKQCSVQFWKSAHKKGKKECNIAALR